ncbi:MAG: hypothetical protein Q8J92_09660 [Parvibaculum sp.]|nr:hypothetical protein [Parvibaculum sp.]
MIAPAARRHFRREAPEDFSFFFASSRLRVPVLSFLQTSSKQDEWVMKNATNGLEELSAEIVDAAF